jgi:CRISPR/Cas system CSM-associated protein Csm5 (group 7 of RAMP superfamily)
MNWKIKAFFGGLWRMGGNVQNEIPVINVYQKERYEDYEKRTANVLLDKYTAILDKTVENNKKIKILDIGGASGHFAMTLYIFEAEDGGSGVSNGCF